VIKSIIHTPIVTSTHTTTSTHYDPYWINKIRDKKIEDILKEIKNNNN